MLRFSTSLKKVDFILKALTASLKSIGNVVLMMIVFMLVYAGIGLNVFKGQLEVRCRNSQFPGQNPNDWEMTNGANYICGNKECPPGTFCVDSSKFDVPFRLDFT